MKFQFNPDGSVKLPVAIQQAPADADRRMATTRCLNVKKEVMTPHKRCTLHVKLSPLVSGDVVEKLHSYFKSQSETPTKIQKLNDKEYLIEIGEGFRRCSDCSSFVGRMREFMDGNVILDKGNCTYEPRSFSYDDHFD